ncbi:hypothetical protein AQUCO_00900513v1 [Aquilegia coerulea]|uniref:Uncharacterized protein n=1 Tax=Aquilegia coerulea TaxID=218851 RepID=A0A2G5EE41_AQUCA|nr:hypothetical protein AQUCO_00900513v1 [Aquilegia coerulea]
MHSGNVGNPTRKSPNLSNKNSNQMILIQTCNVKQCNCEQYWNYMRSRMLGMIWQMNLRSVMDQECYIG